MELKDINDKTNIFDLHEKTDFTQVLHGHKERIDHFVDFMDQNKVPHLPVEVMGERLPFDERYNEMHAKGEIRHFIHQSPVEQQRRLEEYYLEMWKVTRNFAKQYRKSDKKVESLNKELKAIKGSKFYKLNRKYHAIKKKFKN